MPESVRRFLCVINEKRKNGMGNRRCKLVCNRMFDRPDADAANAASSSEPGSRDGRFDKIEIISRRKCHEEKTENIRKEAVKLHTYTGDDSRADAGDEFDGICI